MRINKIFKTETAHIVRNAVSSRCKFNIHGHSYKWIIYIESAELSSNGMVLDFKELQPIKEFIDQFDHSCVFWNGEDSKIIDFFTENFKRVIVMNQNPTAENMARLVHKYVTDWLNLNRSGQFKCSQVDVWETETGCGTAFESNSNDTINFHRSKIEE
jgi:6-pyruvoyltetrahydropterin/6-carboxytetrahydropterin synthase